MMIVMVLEIETITRAVIESAATRHKVIGNRITAIGREANKVLRPAFGFQIVAVALVRSCDDFAPGSAYGQAGGHIMTSDSHRATFRSSATVLCVNAIQPMLNYFEERLGFRIEGTAGELPSWASLQRDGVEIMLACGHYPQPASDWAIYTYVDDVDALYAEYQDRGADIVSEPVDKGHGSREFEVRLPDGRLMAFGSAI